MMLFMCPLYSFWHGIAYRSELLYGKKRPAEPVAKESISQEKKNVYKLPLYLSPVVIAVLMLIITGGYLVTFKPKPIYLSKPMAEFPVIIGDWRGYDTAFTKPPFKFFLLIWK